MAVTVPPNLLDHPMVTQWRQVTDTFEAHVPAIENAVAQDDAPVLQGLLEGPPALVRRTLAYAWACVCQRPLTELASWLLQAVPERVIAQGEGDADVPDLQEDVYDQMALAVGKVGRVDLAALLEASVCHQRPTYALALANVLIQTAVTHGHPALIQTTMARLTAKEQAIVCRWQIQAAWPDALDAVVAHMALAPTPKRLVGWFAQHDPELGQTQGYLALLERFAGQMDAKAHLRRVLRWNDDRPRAAAMAILFEALPDDARQALFATHPQRQFTEFQEGVQGYAIRQREQALASRPAQMPVRPRPRS